MALTATVYRIRIALSDVDRSVYEDLDLRLARHPSETMPYLLTRTLAYALSYEPGIEMGPGLSTPDAPAVRVLDANGSLTHWIEVGTPSAERLHRASKASPHVSVFTQHDPALVLRAANERAIHRAEHILVHAVDAELLRALEAATDRNSRWELTRSEGELYMKLGERTVQSVVAEHRLVKIA